MKNFVLSSSIDRTLALQVAAPKPAPMVKWRDMSTTIMGEPTENATVPPPPPCAAGTPPAAPGENTLSDGILDQPPPDLTGINGAGFNIATEIDLECHVLLDILSDKPLAPQQKNSLPLHVPGVEVPAAVTPQASEWEKW
jgi:hypothetical protein